MSKTDSNYEFIPAEEKHIEALVADIAPDTAGELQKLLPETPLEDIVRMLMKDSTEAWVAMFDGELICAFGIKKGTMLSDTAHPWLVVTNLLQKHKKNFLWASKIGIAYWLKKYGVLDNWIPFGFPKILRWLKWAGFTIGPPTKPRNQTQIFYHIEMRL